MKGVPFFSVIIPLYNKERDIDQTLQSLTRQTFDSFEVVVVDDGSTDESLLIVQQFKDPRLRVFTKKNEGVAPTRNFGVEKANCDFVVFLDADDLWYPFHLEDLYDLIKKFPDGKWFATAYEKSFNQKLVRPLNSPILQKGASWQGKIPDFFENSLVDCLAWTSAVCFKKSFFQSLNGFDTRITMGAGEDTDLWLRAALESPLVFTNRVSATHNLQGSNRISHSPTRTRKFMNLDLYEERAKENVFLKKYLDLNRFSIALQHKYAGDDKTFREYAEKLDKNQLSGKQKFLLAMPIWGLKLAWFIKNKLEALGIRATSF